MKVAVRSKSNLWITNWPSEPSKRPELAGKCSKSSVFALVGDPAAVTWVINHSMFIKWSQIRFLGPKRIFLDQNWLPDHKSSLNWPKNVWNHLETSDYSLTGDQTAITWKINFLIFRISKVVGLKRRFPEHTLAPLPLNQPESTKKLSPKYLT